MICSLCPRRCNARRDENTGAGRCGMPSVPVLARAALHFWEEPPISGSKGSGTVFFSGCSLGCVFCQNYGISHDNFGQAVSVARLREICSELIAQGAHNLNFVNPTHYAHVLCELLQDPFPVPVVYNTGGYDRVETLRALAGKVDIYLPDLKYLDGEAAARYSGAADYPETAKAAIREMYRQVGPCVLDNGLLKRGVVIRHLVLPGRVAEAKRVMDWVAESFPAGSVLFSLMSQYVPYGELSNVPELSRRLRRSEARSAEEYMRNLGLAGFAQDGQAADMGFIPAFDLTGVEKTKG